MLKKISTQKKSDSRDVEIKKLTEFNKKLKSQTFNLKEKIFNLQAKNHKLKTENLELKGKLSKKGRRLEDIIEEHFNETDK